MREAGTKRDWCRDYGIKYVYGGTVKETRADVGKARKEIMALKEAAKAALRGTKDEYWDDNQPLLLRMKERWSVLELEDGWLTRRPT